MYQVTFKNILVFVRASLSVALRLSVFVRSSLLLFLRRDLRDVRLCFMCSFGSMSKFTIDAKGDVV